MAAPDRQGNNKTARSEQFIENSGFDEAFQVPAREMLAFNASSNTIDRMQVNNAGELLTAAPGVSSTPSNTSVNDSATNVTLLSANASRKEAKFSNDSASILYLKEGATASSTSYTVKLYQDDVYITDFPGRIDGIWSADSTGAVRITEINKA